MTQPQPQPQPLDLDAIETRAAHLYEYTQQTGEGDTLAGTDVPAMADEIRRLRAQVAMVCGICDTPVGWVNCPTGGWWAHEQHPADGHDASPQPTAEEAHVVADDSSDPGTPAHEIWSPHCDNGCCL
jgi:hypothetical protein